MLAGVRHSFTRAYIDTQKFVLGGSHVGKVRFTLGLFLVQKLIHWLVSRSLAQMGHPRLVVRLLLEMCLPDSSTAGSTQAKLIIELRQGKRRTSLISVMSYAAVVSPTPYMGRTIHTSGDAGPNGSSRPVKRPAWP